MMARQPPKLISRVATVLLFFLTFLVVTVGCDRYRRYQVATLFFDGVPHPDEPLLQARLAQIQDFQEAGEKQVGKRTSFSHPLPVAEEACGFCHGKGFPLNIKIPPSDMCLTCHSRLKIGMDFIHAPAGLDCVACHDIHKSSVISLVRVVGNALCFSCHYQGGVIDLLQKNKAHQVEEDQMFCLACHDPHAGMDRFLLKSKKNAIEKEII